MKNELKGTAAETTKKASAPKAAEKTASEKEEALVKAAAKTVEKVAEKTEKAAAKAAARTGKTVAKVAAKTEKAAAKTAEKVAETKEKAAKTVAKRTTTRKTAVKETVYLQYLGKEIDKEELVNQVKELWTGELGRKASELKTLTLYLKPEENAAYYVINDDVTGKLAL